MKGMRSALNKGIDTKAVGRRIHDIRVSHNYTQKYFGEFIGRVNKSAVNNWEKGRNLPSKDKLERIAFLGKTSVKDLMKNDIKKYLIKPTDDQVELPFDLGRYNRIIQMDDETIWVELDSLGDLPKEKIDIDRADINFWQVGDVIKCEDSYLIISYTEDLKGDMVYFRTDLKDGRKLASYDSLEDMFFDNYRVGDRKVNVEMVEV